MTNQQPDNFFREKLADYHKPAPAGAWDKIELSLKKTETKFAWWKVAASLLLLVRNGVCSLASNVKLKYTADISNKT